jgi:predicted exporter
MQGHVSYPSGQPVDWLAPYWMVLLWGELAIALNVTMRWLKGRWWLAALLGAVGGPAAFSAGVQLGGAAFIDKTAALTTLTIAYAVLMPLLVWLGTRFDGVAVPEPARHV